MLMRPEKSKGCLSFWGGEGGGGGSSSGDAGASGSGDWSAAEGGSSAAAADAAAVPTTVALFYPALASRGLGEEGEGGGAGGSGFDAEPAMVVAGGKGGTLRVFRVARTDAAVAARPEGRSKVAKLFRR
jgi:hypothetical protein